MATTLTGKALYLRLLQHVRPYWKLFALSMIATVVLAATEPAIPALLKPLLDGSFVDRDPTTIRLMPLLLIGLFIVRGLASYTSTVSLAWVSTRVVMNLRNLMLDRLLCLPNTYFDNNASGNIMSKLTYNVSQVTSAATSVLMVLVRDTLTIIGLLAWMLYLNWKLALIIFLVVPMAAFIIRAISARLRRLSRSLQDTVGDMTHILEETISGNRVVKIFGGQEYERKRFAAVSNWVRRWTMKLKTTSAASVPAVELLAVVGLAVIVYIATSTTGKHAFTVGGFVSFFGALGLLFAPTKRLTKINEQLQRGLAAAESVFSLLDEPTERDTGTRQLPRARGNLVFDHMSFRYPGSESDALRAINLDIGAGEAIALVGQSGSGKTSIANLIPRFYVPTEGRILLDGVDIQDLRLADLRRNLSLVTQDVVLFNGSVAENIAYGAMGAATQEQITEAARAAHALEFIATMPEGMDTLIGENGVRLSGGQRQRLAIARALLKDAPILILDEATSALDAESEQHVQSALETLMKNRTTIVIAHRLSTIRNADRIVVLDKGRVVETGSHDELLAAGGRYAQLYETQFAAEALDN
jgi:subfamily B ATP-binding cassette protein MsbA